MFNSTQIKKAWKIRKEAAVKWNCRIMEISWKECIRMAKEKTLDDFDGRTWNKFGKKRKYLKSDYAHKGNAYITADKTDTKTKYVWNLFGLFLCANKCYNGALESEMNLTREDMI